MSKITLLHHTPLWVCAHAVRTCWESHDRGDKGGPKDRALIEKVGNKLKHSSTLEHLTYNFFLEDFSRALLQELARHRIASLSVKSTRYTLKELRDEPEVDPYNSEHVGKFCVLTDIMDVNFAIGQALLNLQSLIKAGVPNDLAKFAIPDAYKTKATWSINARSLQNFLKLRTAPSAMWEIRLLARAVFKALPEDHKYLFEESVYEDKTES